MSHKISMFVLTALIAVMSFVNTAHAANDAVNYRMFYADYNHGVFTGVMFSEDNESVRAIEWTLLDEDAPVYEDSVQSDENGFFYADVEINSDGSFNYIFQHNNLEFAWRYADELVEVTDLYTNEYGMRYAKIDGLWHQICDGSIENGLAYLLRGARPDTTYGAHGLLLQDHNIVKIYAAWEPVVKYNIFLPSANR